MGIPRLTALLHPFATQVEWKRQHADPSPNASPQVLIDGPALAYFIYHQCLSSEAIAANALEAAPSYAKLAETVVAWLDEIEEFGVKVSVQYSYQQMLCPRTTC